MTAVDWAAAGAALAGQMSSGDRAVFVPFPGGALVAVIDGLGHGKEACEAAAEAERVLVATPYEPVDLLMLRCHEALRQTRGAVISMASFNVEASTMTWLGVGNVEGMLVRPRTETAEAVPMRGGTVGFVMPSLDPRTVSVQPGDTLVFATDGIRHGFRQEVIPSRSPQEIADQVLAHWARQTDDACVAVARYVGETGTKLSINGEADVAHARIHAREVARGMGFLPPDADALATAVSELARNVVVHAYYGEVVFTPSTSGLAVVVRDHGPGIADVEQALQDGYSTVGGLGCGLPGARRLVDRLEIASTLGVGTVVKIIKVL